MTSPSDEVKKIKQLLQDAADAIAMHRYLVAASKVNEALSALKRLE